MTTKRLDQLTAHPRTTSNPLTKASVAVVRDAALSSDNTRKVTLQEVRAYTYNVRDYGATGNGTTNDTASINAALAAALAANGGTVFVPAGTYLVTSSINVGRKCCLIGEGYGSVLQGSSVSGAVIGIGASDGLDQYSEVSHLRIAGTATTGLKVNDPTVSVDMIWLYGGTFTDGLELTHFASRFTNIWTNGATISRYCFYCHTDFNANYCANWYTSNFCTTNVFVENCGGGVVMNVITCQGGDIGLHIKQGQGLSVQSLYTENAAVALKLGEYGVSSVNGVQISGGLVVGAYTSHPAYATSYGALNLEDCTGVALSGIRFAVDGTSYISFSGGGGSGAAAVGLFTPTGTLKSIVVTSVGTGYTSNPTVVIGGGGSGATATANRTGTTVTSVTVTAAGSGYPINASTALIVYKACGKVVLSGCYAGGFQGTQTPLWAYVARHSTLGSSGSAVTIIGDTSRLYSDDAADASMRKAQGLGWRHYIEEIDVSGNRVATEYIPPAFP